MARQQVRTIAPLPLEEAHPLDALMPSDPLIRIAWADCLRYVVTDPEALAAFRRETGCTWTPGATPIERLVDEATGADCDWLMQFVSWFNVNLWGPLDLVARGEA